jgi:hypothetical protein
MKFVRPWSVSFNKQTHMRASMCVCMCVIKLKGLMTGTINKGRTLSSGWTTYSGGDTLCEGDTWSPPSPSRRRRHELLHPTATPSGAHKSLSIHAAELLSAFPVRIFSPLSQFSHTARSLHSFLLKLQIDTLRLSHF